MDDATRERILKNPKERAKLREELRAMEADAGIQRLTPLKGQNEFQVLADLQQNRSEIQDRIAAADERRYQSERASKEEARRKRMNLTPDQVAKLIEDNQRRAYEARNGRRG